MTTYYDPLLKKWYHEKGKTLGHNKITTERPLHPQKEWLTFPLNEESQHLGPIVGILTSKGKNNKIAGNGPLFLSLQKYFYKLGALAILFTPEEYNESVVTGYTFLPSIGKWKRISSPLPEVVYNRIPFRKREKDADYYTLLSRLQARNIPFFNPSFINKLEMHHLLRQSSLLKPLLPDTSLLTSEEMLSASINKNQKIYIKPASSAKGKGIYRISALDNYYLMEGIHSVKKLETFQQLWHEISGFLTQEPYIIQRAIEPALYDGLRYDFRILSHKAGNRFKVSGIGIRQSSCQQVTTHVPNGGRILPYSLFDTAENEQFFNAVIQEIGQLLTENMGLFGEFSVDMGLGSDGKFYLYEVNSKPMSFDEVHIENNRIKAIGDLCMQLSGFSMFSK